MILTMVIEFVALFLPMITLNLGIFGSSTLYMYEMSDTTIIVIGLIVMSLLMLISINRVNPYNPSMKAGKILAVIGIIGGVLGILYIIGSIEIGVQQVIEEYNIDISNYLAYQSGFYFHIIGNCIYVTGSVMVFMESRKMPAIANPPPMVIS